MKKLLAAAAGLGLICGLATAQEGGRTTRTPDEGAPPGNSMEHQPAPPTPMPDNRTDRGTLGDQEAPHLAPSDHSGTLTDYSRFHANERAPHRYHAGEWQGPAGYSYHRWAFGQKLPAAYYVREYWIGSFAMYGLMVPPPGTAWVRYGPDAILVERDTGEILRVEYGIFY